MSIMLKRGGETNSLATTGGSETKGLATPGGVVSPFTRQKKLSSKLTVMGTQNNVLYAKG